MTIEEMLKAQIDNLDLFEIATNVVKEMIRPEVTTQIKKAVADKIDSMVIPAIEAELRKPVHADDGWGKKVHHDSFEDMFRAEFAKKLAETWKVQEMIQRSVTQRVNEMVDAKKGEVVKRIVEELTK